MKFVENYSEYYVTRRYEILNDKILDWDYNEKARKRRRCIMADGTNIYTTLLALAILMGIVLITRFILRHGSHQHSTGCCENCGSCGAGCTSSFSSEKKDFDRIMGEDTVSRTGGEADHA